MSTALHRGLTSEELSRLTDEELELYLALLEAEENEWRLEPVQQRAEDMSATVDFLFYGGAAGGGKTDWMMWHAQDQALRFPGISMLAVRRTFPQLKRSLITRSLEKFDTTKARYLVGEKEWRWHNGSTLTFGHLDAEEDVRHYLSSEYDIIFFEEMTEFTEYQVKMLGSRNRTTVSKRARGIRPHRIGASNPGQVGHGWVKEQFVQATDYGAKLAVRTIEYGGKKRDETIAFVPAKVTDNRHIDPDYVFNLASLPEIQRKQYLEGDWDAFEGQFFTEWRKDTHVVAPFVVPRSWPRIRGYDYGFAKPAACLWLAFDWDGNAFVYREFYKTLLTATQQGQQIAEMSRWHNEETDTYEEERIDYSVADPSIWTRQGTGISIARQLADAGFRCRKAMNARLDGWSRVRDYLQGGDGNDHPYLRVFPGCSNLIRTLPNMIFDKTKAEDLNTDLEDHAVDALRYALMSRPRQARRVKVHEDTAGRAPDGAAIERAIRARRKGPIDGVLGRGGW